MISFIRGYYVITVEGIDTERFLNYLIRNKIYVYNVNRVSKTKIEFSINREDYKRLKDSYRSSKYDIKVKQRTGIPFLMKRIYSYRGMVICAIISLVVLMATSQFVTDVYVTVPEGIDKESVENELYVQGVKPGVYKKNINRKIVRDSIMSKFDKIAYVSINVKGTNILVNVTKKDESRDSKENSNYCNVIASKDGIIEKVVARSGEAIVQEGDIVKKGDVLVNGANTTALPEIWATTFYEEKKSSNYIDVKKQKTGNKKNIYTISFYDKKYKIMRNIKYKDYVIENETKDFKIGNYTFPVKIIVSSFCEVEDVENKIDENKLKEELKKSVKNEIEYMIPVSARIVDAKEKYNVRKNMVEYVLTVTTSEDIAQLDILTKNEAHQIIKQNSDKLKEEGEEINSNPSKRPLNDMRNEFKEDDKDNKKDETN